MKYKMNLTVTITSKEGDRRPIEDSFEGYYVDGKKVERGDDSRERMKPMCLVTLQILG